MKAPLDGPVPGAVVIYDGECALCAGSIRFIAAHDPHRRFRFAASSSEVGRALLAQQGLLQPGGSGTMVFIDGDRVFVRSTAVLRIAARLPWPWRALAAALVVPAPLRDVVYRMVARYRHRWFGRPAACAPLPADVKARLL